MHGEGFEQDVFAGAGGFRFTKTNGESANFGAVNYGTAGAREATITYWLETNASGAWNTFGAGGPGYYYALSNTNRLTAMVQAKNSSGAGVNDWPQSPAVTSTAIGKPVMVTAVMKEDHYFKWYVNGELVSTRAPPNHGHYRFYNGAFRAGQGYSTSGVQFDGTIHYVSSYNRALSDYEIQQNFKAMRDRFGL